MQTGVNNRMADRVDPDETARNEPSHLDLHCLQKYVCWEICTDEKFNNNKTLKCTACGAAFDVSNLITQGNWLFCVISLVNKNS